MTSRARTRTVVVIGAGLAGLVAAHTLLERGAEVVVLEAAVQPGGTSLLSAGWIWRYRTPPHGGELQMAIWNELPDAIDWLESLAGGVEQRSTANPETEGVQWTMSKLIGSLAAGLPDGVLWCSARAIDAVDDRAESSVTIGVQTSDGRRQIEAGAVVFAGGGFAGDLPRVASAAGVAQCEQWIARNAGTADGSSIDIAGMLGAAVDLQLGRCYARAIPDGARIGSRQWSSQACVLGSVAPLIALDGRLVPRAPDDWSDSELIWQLACCGGAGWFALDEQALRAPGIYGTVAELIPALAAHDVRMVRGEPGAMAEVLTRELGYELDDAAERAVRDATCAIRVRAGLTHSLGGLQVDHRAAVKGVSSEMVTPIHAAGADVLSAPRGGYSSGLAQALTLGRIAGREIDLADS